MSQKRTLCIAAGPILMVLCCMMLPVSLFDTLSARAAIGTVLWMAFWWVTAPVDYAVTALLPIALNAVVPMAEMPLVIANYASETILLLLGASILTVSWEMTGLDRRIAVSFLNMIGNSLRKQIIFWFLISEALSAVLPNAVVCATITPIAVSMLRYVGQEDIGNSRPASKILLTIVYAAGVGGLASPLGGAMNLVVVDYIQQLTGKEYMYISWVIRFLPAMLAITVTNILFLVRDVKGTETLGGSREYFLAEYRSLGRMSYEEKVALALFLAATVLSFTRQFYQELLPGLKPAYVFVICAILSFLVMDKSGKRLLVWRSVQSKIVWELIFIFAGGLAAGTLINESKAAGAIGAIVGGSRMSDGFLLIFMLIAMTLLLSDVTSNTATAAVAMPIVISIIQGIGKNPIPYIYVAAVGVNLSYMLPTSIRAIPVGYGLQPKYMLKEGWKMTVMMLFVLSILCYLLLRHWSLFQTV